MTTADPADPAVPGRDTSTEAPAVEIVGVTKRFDRLVAVDDLSLTVARGEILGVLGPNGSGKTTLMNMLSGLTRPSSGTIRILGLDPATGARAIRRRLGTVPQETALYEELTAEANLAFHADLFGLARPTVATRIAEVLDLVSLTERRRDRVATFSGGMKRRLALARALLHEPDLLYLDEPTLGVDVQSRRALWDRVLEIGRSGRTVVVTTNYLEEAQALCDRIAILDHGHLVAVDTPEGLARAHGQEVLELTLDRTPSAATVQAARELPGVRDATATGAHVRVALVEGAAPLGVLLRLFSEHTTIQELDQRRPTLDDVFLDLTGRQVRD